LIRLQLRPSSAQPFVFLETIGKVSVGPYMEPPIDDRLPLLKAPTVIRYASAHEVNDSVGRTRRGTGNALRRAYPVQVSAPEDMLRLLRQLDD